MLNNRLFLTLALVAIVLAYGIYVMPANSLKRPRDPAGGALGLTIPESFLLRADEAIQ